MLVLDCERKNGIYKPDENSQGIPWDNLYFTVDTGSTEGMLFGTKKQIIKVSVKDFNKYYNQDVMTLKGKDVIFAFDQNKHLIGIYNVK